MSISRAQNLVDAYYLLPTYEKKTSNSDYEYMYNEKDDIVYDYEPIYEKDIYFQINKTYNFTSINHENKNKRLKSDNRLIINSNQTNIKSLISINENVQNGLNKDKINKEYEIIDNYTKLPKEYYKMNCITLKDKFECNLLNLTDLDYILETKHTCIVDKKLKNIKCNNKIENITPKNQDYILNQYMMFSHFITDLE